MKKILEFLKKYKIQILCSAVGVILIIAVSLAIILCEPTGKEETPEPDPGASSMSRLEQLMAQHAAGGDKEDENNVNNNDKPLPNYHAQLAEEMLVITSLPYDFRYTPKITVSSSADDMLYYGAVHTEFPYTYHPVENGNIAAADQEQLMRAVNWFNQSIMTDPDKEFGEDGYWMLPVTYIPETGQCVYSKETVSWLVEYLYGVSDYVIDCPQYDPATETYTIMASGRGGYSGPWYGESAKWIDGDTFACTYLNYYVQDITGDAPKYLLSKEDWTTRCTMQFKRSGADPENFVLVSIKYEYQDAPVPTQEDLDKEVPTFIPSQGGVTPYNDRYDPQPTVSDSQLNALRAEWAKL